jgi:putative endonuclease
MAAKPWWLYVVRTRDDALYTGIAVDVAARVARHAAGRGAKALRGRLPLALVLACTVGARGAALRLEARVKRLPKAAKEDLLAAGVPDAWLRAARRAAAAAVRRKKHHALATVVRTRA